MPSVAIFAWRFKGVKNERTNEYEHKMSTESSVKAPPSIYLLPSPPFYFGMHSLALR